MTAETTNTDIERSNGQSINAKVPFSQKKQGGKDPRIALQLRDSA